MNAETSASLRSAELYWDTAAESYDKDFSGTSVGIVREKLYGVIFSGFSALASAFWN